MRYILPFCALCAFLLAPMEIMAKQVTIIFNTGYPPFVSNGQANAESVVQGMVPDILRQFDKEHDEYELRFVRVPLGRMGEELADGKGDAIGVLNYTFMPPELRNNFKYTQPYWQTGDNIITLKGNGFTFDGPNSLKGKKVGVITGYTYFGLDAMLQSDSAKVYRVRNAEMLLRMLIEGRVQMIIANRHAIMSMLQENAIPQDTVSVIEPPLYDFPHCAVVRKDRPEFFKKLNAFIEKSRHNGFIRSVQQKWLGSTAKSATTNAHDTRAHQ